MSDQHVVPPARRRARRGARLLGAAAVATLAIGLTMPVGTSWAGSNSAQGHCLKAYNYADTAGGYLFASTEATGGCQTVHVSLFNHGTISGGASTEGSECFGSGLDVSGAHLYTSASASLDSAQWSTPCSHHWASYQFIPPASELGMWFLY